MRGGRRVAGVGLAAAIAAAGVTVWSGSANGVAQDDPASRALLYLQSKQSANDGSLQAFPGDFGSGELYAIGAATAGYDPKVLRHGSTGPTLFDFLRAHVTQASASAGKCAELIQAVEAAALNPRQFAGHDLVATLNATYHAGTGAFGDGEAFTQALAIQALRAAAAPIPGAAVSYVKNAQDSDGGWNYLDRKNNSAGSDTNSTAMSLMALDAAGDHSRDATALHWLHSQQLRNGSFPFNSSGPGDPDSTALVLQAIVATGQDPAGAVWAVQGHTPVSALVAAQGTSGGYTFPGNSGPDVFTTSQVVPALDRVPLPVPFWKRPFYTPGKTLGPSPTPTPAPTRG